MAIIDPNVVEADFVIQVSVVFKPKKSNLLGAIHIWKKSGWFGKADELMKFCPTNGCKGLISDSIDLPEEALEVIGENDLDDTSKWPPKYQQMYDQWFTSPTICPKCGAIGIREELPDSYGFHMSTEKIGDCMAEFFENLGGAADIYMVRTKENMVFHKAREELYSGPSNFKKYKKTLSGGRDRDCVFYSLKSIISDTTSGSGLPSRFKALLEA